MAFKIFLLWTFVLIARPQDLLTSLQTIRPALIISALAASATILEKADKGWSQILGMSETRRYLFFYLIMILGIPFAYYRRQAFEFVFHSYLMNIAFFIISLVQINSFERIKKVLLIVLISIFIYGIFGIYLGSFAGGRFKIYGEMFDPNDIAYVLLSLFPLCLFYIFHRESFLKALLAIVSIGTSFVVILLSGSRGGILGLCTVCLLLLFGKSLNIKSSYKIIFVVAVSIFIFINIGKINVERYMSLSTISNDYNVIDETGRLHIWQRAFDLFISNPILGVGVTCFPMAIGYMREALGLLPVWQVTHNSYIQVGVETGLFGLLIFLAMIMRCIKTFSEIGKLQVESSQIREFKNMNSLILIGFIGQLVMAFFLSQAYSIIFTLFFVLFAVMRRLSLEFSREKTVS